MNEPMGYNWLNGALSIDPDEAKIVTFVYSQFDKYCKNPPADLVERIYQDRLVREPSYTMEQATEAAKNMDYLLDYIAKEINEKFPAELRARALRKLNAPPSYNPQKRRGEISHTKVAKIIDRATFEKVQDAIKAGQTAAE